MVGRVAIEPTTKRLLLLALAHAKRADLAANDGRDLIGFRRSDECLDIRPDADRQHGA